MTTYVQVLSRGGTGSMSLLLQPDLANVVSSDSRAHVEERKRLKELISEVMEGTRSRSGLQRVSRVSLHLNDLPCSLGNYALAKII